MNKIRYLFDEHVSSHLRNAVRKYDSDIIIRRIGEADTPEIGTADSDILIWCETDYFSLITNNRRTMPEHLKAHLAKDRHVPGIFIINPNMTMDETAYELSLIAGAGEPAEFRDRLIYLPITKQLK